MTRTVRSDWARALLICSKCSRKMGGGFGTDGKQRLMKALRAHLGTGKAVVVINGCDSKLWHIVPKGTAVEDLVEELGL